MISKQQEVFFYSICQQPTSYTLISYLAKAETAILEHNSRDFLELIIPIEYLENYQSSFSHFPPLTIYPTIVR